MTFAKDFIDNAATLLKKPVMLAGVALGLFANTLTADAQRVQKDEDRFGKDLWMFNVGVVANPDNGVAFNFHGVTPGVGNKGTWFRQHNWLRGGSTLTGQSIGGSGKYQTWGGEGYWEWSRRYSRANLDYVVGAKKEFGKNSVVMAGGLAQANVFPGGYSNLLNFAELNLGATGMVSIGLGRHFALTATVNTSLAQFKNESSWRNYFNSPNNGQPIATHKQVNPKVEGQLSLTFTPNISDIFKPKHNKEKAGTRKNSGTGFFYNN